MAEGRRWKKLGVTLIVKDYGAQTLPLPKVEQQLHTTIENQ